MGPKYDGVQQESPIRRSHFSDPMWNFGRVSLMNGVTFEPSPFGAGCRPSTDLDQKHPVSLIDFHFSTTWHPWKKQKALYHRKCESWREITTTIDPWNGVLLCIPQERQGKSLIQHVTENDSCLFTDVPLLIENALPAVFTFTKLLQEYTKKFWVCLKMRKKKLKFWWKVHRNWSRKL